MDITPKSRKNKHLNAFEDYKLEFTVIINKNNIVRDIVFIIILFIISHLFKFRINR